MTSLKKTALACCLALLASPLVAAPTPGDPPASANAQTADKAEAYDPIAERIKNSVKFSELLAKGFEIKAAIAMPGATKIDAFVVLQKGGEAYQCSTATNIYNNAYMCVPMLDATKADTFR